MSMNFINKLPIPQETKERYPVSSAAAACKAARDEEIAKVFESGRRYTEREVNIIIADFHDDFCTIRRDMISEGLLDRENGQYWKK